MALSSHKRFNWWILAVKEEITAVLYKFFTRIVKEETVCNGFYKPNILLIPNSDRYMAGKENQRQVYQVSKFQTKHLKIRSGARRQRSKKSHSSLPTNTSKKTHLQVKLLTQNISWTLEVELTSPKRARSSLHNCENIRRKKKRQKESGQDWHSQEGAVKEKKNPHPG